MIDDYELNKLYTDANGKVSGVFAFNKPVGLTSHDVVDLFRKKYNTRRVGHAGALDPFASGLLVILVGKYTSHANDFLTLDKEYVADILFGIATDSGDPEGKVTEILPPTQSINLQSLETILKSFQPGYEQYVPVFSSVKVEGNKLRELARKSDSFSFVEKDTERYAHFYRDGHLAKEVNLPKKNIQIYAIELEDVRAVSSQEIAKEFRQQITDDTQLINRNFEVATIRVRCSKGTYLRQLAVDIGSKLHVPAMLINLQRTKVGTISLEKCIR